MKRLYSLLLAAALATSASMVVAMDAHLGDDEGDGKKSGAAESLLQPRVPSPSAVPREEDAKAGDKKVFTLTEGQLAALADFAKVASDPAIMSGVNLEDEEAVAAWIERALAKISENGVALEAMMADLSLQKEAPQSASQPGKMRKGLNAMGDGLQYVVSVPGTMLRRVGYKKAVGVSTATMVVLLGYVFNNPDLFKAVLTGMCPEMLCGK